MFVRRTKWCRGIQIVPPFSCSLINCWCLWNKTLIKRQVYHCLLARQCVLEFLKKHVLKDIAKIKMKYLLYCKMSFIEYKKFPMTDTLYYFSVSEHFSVIWNVTFARFIKFCLQILIANGILQLQDLLRYIFRFAFEILHWNNLLRFIFILWSLYEILQLHDLLHLIFRLK